MKIRDVMVALQQKFDTHGMSISVQDKEDLDMPNHLTGKVKKRCCVLYCDLYVPQSLNLLFKQLKRYLKLSFNTVTDLQEVRVSNSFLTMLVILHVN